MTTTKTLWDYLQPVAVDYSKIQQNYKPMLALVKELLGVVPSCDPILEIWPIGFRTYNLLVPNMLNLPNNLSYN